MLALKSVSPICSGSAVTRLSIQAHSYFLNYENKYGAKTSGTLQSWQQTEVSEQVVNFPAYILSSTRLVVADFVHSSYASPDLPAFVPLPLQQFL